MTRISCVFTLEDLAEEVYRLPGYTNESLKEQLGDKPTPKAQVAALRTMADAIDLHAARCAAAYSICAWQQRTPETNADQVELLRQWGSECNLMSHTLTTRAEKLRLLSEILDELLVPVTYPFGNADPEQPDLLSPPVFTWPPPSQQD